MKAYIDKAVVVAEIERRKYQFVSQAEAFHGIGKEDKESYFAALASNMNSLLSFLDTLEMKEVEEEPVSNDLEEAAYQFGNCFENHFGLASMSFIKGAQWQKEQMIDKACNYLFSHMGLIVTFFDDDIVEDIERSEFIKKFRKEMEDKT